MAGRDRVAALLLAPADVARARRTPQLRKFRCNRAAAARPIAPEAAERVIAAVARLESLPDVTVLVGDLVPAPADHPASA